MRDDRKKLLSADYSRIHDPIKLYLLEDRPTAYHPHRHGDRNGTVEKAALDGAFAAGYEEALKKLDQLARITEH